MNLELPFERPTPADLDAFLAEIDRELDALFLEELGETLEVLRDERRSEATA